MPSTDIVFARIDALLERIRKYASEPEFSKEIRSRERTPNFDLPDNDVLWEMIEVIALSQAVPAKRIGDMIDRGVFSDVFGSFDPATVARMKPEDIYKRHWKGKLSPIRFPNKIDAMVACAISLRAIAKQHGSFMNSLKAAHFPERIHSNADIGQFWEAFERASRQAPPYFQKNFTSMCHLLQTYRFPCAKPDKVVMKVAVSLGIVSDRKKYPESDLRKVVQFMQSYAAQRGMSVPMVDLIFLIHGGQSWAKKLVRAS
jgi:3-methyladenine DNA glycosylase Tag